jgi:hypothetical protein
MRLSHNETSSDEIIVQSDENDGLYVKVTYHASQIFSTLAAHLLVVDDALDETLVKDDGLENILGRTGDG